MTLGVSCARLSPHRDRRKKKRKQYNLAYTPVLGPSFPLSEQLPACPWRPWRRVTWTFDPRSQHASRLRISCSHRASCSRSIRKRAPAVGRTSTRSCVPCWMTCSYVPRGTKLSRSSGLRIKKRTFTRSTRRATWPIWTVSPTPKRTA